MRIATSVSLVSLFMLVGATGVSAKDYTYTAPASTAATQALQTPPKAQPPAQLAMYDTADTTAIDPTSGQIRPATRVADTWRHDGEHRGFACADQKCKTQIPVYNTRTPIEQEQGRIQP